MSTFGVHVMSPTQFEKFDDVQSFKAKDASGSFGILANAFRTITVLSFGIASLNRSGGSSEYIGLPGGVLYLANNILKIATTSFVHSSNIEEVREALEKKIRRDEKNIAEIKKSLHQLDDEILKRLSRISKMASE